MRKFVYRFSIVIGFIIIVAGTGFLARHEIQRFREGLPAFSHSEADRQSEMISMADGTKLYTTISLPSAGGPFPTILVRNPYAQFGTFMRDSMCGRFTRYGYACVFQDVRGQGKSEGEWAPGLNEANDGRDTIDWLVKQDFQDGNIGMMGPSYLAAVQWASASTGLPPEVKTFIPSVYTTDNQGVMYQDGMFRHETFTAWASTMRGSNSETEDPGADYQKAVRYYPHINADRDIYGTELPWYRDMVSASNPNNEFWNLPETIQLKQTPQNLKVPILMIGGWYDVFLGPQFQDWQRLATQESSRFIIGPWTHAGGGGEAFENPNSDGGLLQWPAMLDWFNHHLKGEPLEAAPGVSAYTMRLGEWQNYDKWPEQTQTTILELNNLSISQECEGGTLLPARVDELPAVFTYDPLNPVPTKGGAGMLAFILPGFGGAPPANVWQESLCDREDILSFTSSPYVSEETISGKIRVTLSVSSTAADTAFTAKLIEVTKDGRAVNIRDSITTLRIQGENVRNYRPGTQTNVEIRFWPIEWQIQPGSKLRLDISSSDFPKFHAHPNKAELWSTVEEPTTADQTVYNGQLHIPFKEG